MRLSVPLVNNLIAFDVKRKLIALPLPESTQIIDSKSYAGKLEGCGNGMQYFGAILIKSDLSLKALNEFYIIYQAENPSLTVEQQTDHIIDFTNQDLSFSQTIDSENYYMISSWGESGYFLSDYDLRGH